MPIKSEKEHKKIPSALKRSSKLNCAEREAIREEYGKVSQRQLAKKYGVSRRLITFIGDPDKHAENLKRRKERGGSMRYYDKDKQRDAIRATRSHRQSLDEQDKLIS
jgi:transposase